MAPTPKQCASIFTWLSALSRKGCLNKAKAAMFGKIIAFSPILVRRNCPGAP
jgi:hypothetical protein